MVEFARLIIVALLAVAGWEIAGAVSSGESHRLLGTVLGAAFGYVAGGVFGRRTASAVTEVEQEFRRLPAVDVLAGAVGFLFGLVIAALLSLPLFHLPAVAAYSTVAFVYVTGGYVGWMVGRSKSEDVFAVLGVKPRAAGSSRGEVTVVDASALLDGRLASLVRLGFVHGTLLVTTGVLEEVQSVADSSEAARRNRGRKALDHLLQLKRHPTVEVVLVDDRESEDAVDARIVRLAKARGAAVLTNDSPLASLAAALDVPVRSIHALAGALRPSVVPGDQVELRLIRAGREAGQAVGYLDDGTMVIVEDAASRIGERADVTVTNSVHTATGRLVFGKLQ